MATDSDPLQNPSFRELFAETPDDSGESIQSIQAVQAPSTRLKQFCDSLVSEQQRKLNLPGDLKPEQNAAFYYESLVYAVDAPLSARFDWPGYPSSLASLNTNPSINPISNTGTTPGTNSGKTPGQFSLEAERLCHKVQQTLLHRPSSSDSAIFCQMAIEKYQSLIEVCQIAADCDFCVWSRDWRLSHRNEPLQTRAFGLVIALHIELFWRGSLKVAELQPLITLVQRLGQTSCFDQTVQGLGLRVVLADFIGFELQRLFTPASTQSSKSLVEAESQIQGFLSQLADIRFGEVLEDYHTALSLDFAMLAGYAVMPSSKPGLDEHWQSRRSVDHAVWETYFWRFQEQIRQLKHQLTVSDSLESTLVALQRLEQSEPSRFQQPGHAWQTLIQIASQIQRCHERCQQTKTHLAFVRKLGLEGIKRIKSGETYAGCELKQFRGENTLEYVLESENMSCSWRVEQES